jgi:AAHS family 4-hydroxybenzoate transporter-like MFS transporter
MEETQIDVSHLVDEQKISGINYVLLGLAFLATTIDGYDIFVPGYLAPELMKAWHFPPAALGPMFSTGLLGIIIGAAAFGHFGDRLGRKRAIVWSSVMYGVLTLTALWTTNLTEFTILRFLIGLGIGGVIPNAIALVVEFTPARARAMFVLLAVVGVSVGQLLPGIVTVALVPSYGWQVLLIIGGLGPILIAILTQWLMPESLKYLTLAPSRRAELLQLARRVRPDMAIPAEARFFIREPTIKSASPAELFSHGLAVLTPLVWLCLASGLLAIYFVSSWLPLVLQGAGLSMQEAAGRLAIFAMGGVVGGLVMAPLMARFGLLALIAVFVVAVPLVGSIGLSGLTTTLILVLTAAAGFCVIAIINGVECVMGMIYPTAIRAKGAGFALAIGRLGAMAGPILGGVLIGTHLSNFQLFLAPAYCLAVGTLASICLAFFYKRRFSAGELSDPMRVAAGRGRA